MDLNTILIVAADFTEACDIINRFKLKSKNERLSTSLLSSDIKLDVLITGYGSCSSMATISGHLIRTAQKYDLLINMGFAGVLNRETSLLVPLEIDRVCKLVPVGHDSTASKIILKSFPEIYLPGKPDTGIKLTSADFPVYGPSYIKDDSIMVDMEGYSIACLAETLGISYKLVKIGSDYVDLPADNQYLRCKPEVPAKLLGDWLEKYLFENNFLNGFLASGLF